MMLAFCLANLITSSSAISQIDPDPDGIGIYMDLEATTVNTDLEPDFINPQGGIFLCITTPSGPRGISAVECHIELEGPASISEIVWAAGGINFGRDGDLIVDFTTPLSVAPVVVMAEIFVLVYAPSMSQFFLSPLEFIAPTIPGEIVYFPDLIVEHRWEARILHKRHGSTDLPVATINGYGPSASASSTNQVAWTWGSVKKLYR